MASGRKRFNQSTILAHVGAACERCPSADALTAHHRNGDPLDDSPGNLEILCLACHRREEGHV